MFTERTEVFAVAKIHVVILSVTPCNMVH